MNAICSFYNLKEYPIDLAGVFQDHMDPLMQKSFCAHYPNFRAMRLRDAITKNSILMDMLNALIKADNNLTNIRDMVRMEQRSGEQFEMGQAMPCVAEKTLRRYANDTARFSQDSRGSSWNKCFGCGKPHPWLKQVDGKYIVICPNTNKPGVGKKAELNISKYQACRKKNARNNKKRKNVNTVNWEDIPEKRCEVILAQQPVHMAVLSSDAASVASSLTGTTKGII
jgi:hypothetical protein